MKRFLFSLLAVAVAVGVVMPAAAAKQTKVGLCHYDNDTGSYNLLSVPERAAGKHLSKHADGRPGEPVPNMEGYSFDESCVPTTDGPSPRPPWLEPDQVVKGTTVTIYDDLSRIEDDDIAFLFQEGASPFFWTAVDLALLPDGSATFVVPDRPAGVYQISVRPAISAEPRFEDLVFTIQ